MTSFGIQNSSLDVLEGCFYAYHWPCERLQNELTMDVEGAYSTYHLTFLEGDKDGGFRIVCRYEGVLLGRGQVFIPQLLKTVNDYLTLGKVAVDVESGSLYFSHHFPSIQDEIKESYVMKALECSVQECDIFYPLWQFLVKGGMLTEEVLHSFVAEIEQA